MIEEKHFKVFGFKLEAYYEENWIGDGICSLHDEYNEFQGFEFDIQGLKEAIEKILKRKIVKIDLEHSDEDNSIFYNLHTEPL